MRISLGHVNFIWGDVARSQYANQPKYLAEVVETLSDKPQILIVDPFGHPLIPRGRLVAVHKEKPSDPFHVIFGGWGMRKSAPEFEACFTRYKMANSQLFKM